MNPEIVDSEGFLEICVRNGIRMIFLDLRGTLFKAPRRGNIVRAAKAAGLNRKEIVELDQRVPGLVMDAYRDEDGVLDWTLVSVLKFTEISKEVGIEVSLIQAEKIYQAIRFEYRDESTPLVTDARLSNFVGALASVGIRTVIAADGVSSFERATFQRLFPDTDALGVDFVASDTLRMNKLAPEFYSECARAYRMSPAECLVVGDRMDKDILSGSRAGCRTVLVGTLGQAATVDGVSPDWTVEAFELLTPNTPRQLDGALFGRFQPFHREHLRFVRHAAAYCARLTIGVTNPFLSDAEPDTNDRTSSDKNPLPFWLRKRWILSALEADGFKLERFSVVPCPLETGKLAQLFKPDTPAYVTDVEEWSEEKSLIIARAGLKICRLSVGSKTISGTQIREMIAAGDPRWRLLVSPVSDDTLYNEIEAHVLGLQTH